MSEELKPSIVARNICIPEDMYNDLLIGGNHLASALHMADCPEPYKYVDYSDVLERKGIPAADMWVAWKAIMAIAAWNTRSA